MRPTLAAIALVACTSVGAQVPTPHSIPVAPAAGVEINQLVVNPLPPPLFGPVLRVKTADGSTRMSIGGDGGIRFERGATLSFEDLVEGDDGRLFVPVWAGGHLMLLEVHRPSLGRVLRAPAP